MKLLDPQVAMPLDVSTDAQALIKEAHQRRRRRRLVVGGIVVVALAAVMVGLFVISPAGRAPKPVATPLPETSTGPVVNKAAFAGEGQLAFVSSGKLWVLDGSKSLVSVHTGNLVPSNPAFSPDGRWLAFVASAEVSHNYSGDVLSTVVTSALWVARSNGTDPRHVQGLIGQAFGWAPHSDLYAVSMASSTSVPFGTVVDLVSPDGSVRQLMSGSHVVSAVWSPSGSSLAVSTESGSAPETSLSATLTSYPVNGGPRMVWQTLDQQYIVPTGWWPDWGIGYTTVVSGEVPGGSASADGSPLFTVAQPGASPKMLGVTLENESTGPPTGTAAGWLAFVETNGGIGRSIWQGKQVVVCSPTTSSCSPIPHPAGTVTLDPTWSPSGLTLAYVQAPENQNVGFPPQTLVGWYNAHALGIYDPSTGSIKTVSGGQGATVPAWSSNGASFLYVSNNSVRLHSSGASSVQIASPLYSTSWPTYYGQVPFSSQFAWSQSPANETSCLSRVNPQC